MIADLKPYPAMEDFGVEWLREVPSRWTRLSGHVGFSREFRECLQDSSFRLRSCFRTQRVHRTGKATESP